MANQRILQAVSDPFLGHLRFDGRDYFQRQFRDRNGAIEASRLPMPEFVTYVGRCAAVLARGHAQSRDAAMVAGYLGSATTIAFAPPSTRGESRPCTACEKAQGAASQSSAARRSDSSIA